MTIEPRNYVRDRNTKQKKYDCVEATIIEKPYYIY